MASPFDWLKDLGEGAVNFLRDLIGAGGPEPEEETPPPPEILSPDIYQVEDIRPPDVETPPYYESLGDDYEEFKKEEYFEKEEPYFAEPEDISVKDPASFEAKDLRKVRYLTAGEAWDYIVSAGIDSFSEVVYYEDEDLYSIAVIYEEPSQHG